LLDSHCSHLECSTVVTMSLITFRGRQDSIHQAAIWTSMEEWSSSQI